MASEVIVLVTTPAKDSMKIADAVVNSGLAACVNILPGVKSVFIWQGERCVEEEELLIIKSKGELFEQLCSKVKELHAYDVPEVIQLNIDDGYAPYLDWLNAGLRQVSSSEARH